MSKHFIYIKDGTLRLIRTMPNEDDHKYWSEDHWKDIFHKDLFDQALTQAKADSVEIAPESIDKIMVLEYGPIGMHTLKEGIYEITTNGVFEVRHKGFFNGGKVEWVRGHAPTNDYEELAYYKEEAKPEQPEAESQEAMWEEYKVWNEEERKKRFTVTKTITRNKHKL